MLVIVNLKGRTDVATAFLEYPTDSMFMVCGFISITVVWLLIAIIEESDPTKIAWRFKFLYDIFSAFFVIAFFILLTFANLHFQKRQCDRERKLQCT